MGLCCWPFSLSRNPYRYSSQNTSEVDCLGVDCTGPPQPGEIDAVATNFARIAGWLTDEEPDTTWYPGGIAGSDACLERRGLPGACCFLFQANFFSYQNPPPKVPDCHSIDLTSCLRGYSVIPQLGNIDVFDRPARFFESDERWHPCRVKAWLGHFEPPNFSFANPPHFLLPGGVEPTHGHHNGPSVLCDCQLTDPSWISPDYREDGVSRCLRPAQDQTPWDEFCEVPSPDLFDKVCDVGMPVVLDPDGRAAFFAGEHKFDRSAQSCQNTLGDPTIRPDGTVEIVSCMDHEGGLPVTYALGTVGHDECSAGYSDLEWDRGFFC